MSSTQTFCDHCGESWGLGSHEECRESRRLEPPRYCAHCRRRMVVQVTPTSWQATCIEHGTVVGDSTTDYSLATPAGIGAVDPGHTA